MRAADPKAKAGEAREAAARAAEAAAAARDAAIKERAAAEAAREAALKAKGIKVEQKGTALFDGKSLEGWKATDFAGGGEIKVEKGQIVMSMGTRSPASPGRTPTSFPRTTSRFRSRR